MDEKIAKDWVAALRSGKYIQGRNALCTMANGFVHPGATLTDGAEAPAPRNRRYCCLGVLADLGVKAGTLSDQNDLLEPAVLTLATVSWSGTHNRDPLVHLSAEWRFERGQQGLPGFDFPSTMKLSNLNDRGVSFNEIADLIDDQWRSL